MRGIAISIALLGLAPWLTLSSIAKEESHIYDFPYDNPYYATITAAIMKGDSKDSTVQSREIRIPGLEERNNNKYYGKDKNFLSLRLWAQEKKAPIILMISGLGGDSSVPYYNYLTYHFYKLGFHLLVIPSPFHWQFAFTSSKTGYPGITKEDAKDLYLVMKKALAKIQRKGVQFSDVGLLGVSMGALEAAYVYKLDQEEGAIGFKKNLLINPPYSVVYGIQKLDELYLNRNQFSNERRKEIERELYIFALKAISFRDIHSPDYFLDIQNRLPLKQEELAYAIGNSMRDFLTKMIFATQEVFDLGILGKKDNPNWVANRIEKSGNINFSDYLKLVLLPYLKTKETIITDFKSLDEASGLAAILPFIKNNPNIKILHNSDDFLVSESHFNFLLKETPKNLVLYPRGGHIGNLWFDKNRREILRYFLPLLNIDESKEASFQTESY
ncbi:MAG: hypothetical protein M9962_00935 [Oligoflexia bacterium]|nr:hypothetical protein [Oligoflexia bacterium]